MSAHPRPARPDTHAVTARRALAQALSGYVDSARVHEAVVLWSQHFEGQGSLAVALHRYCRQIATSYSLVGREAELQLKIFRALQSDPRELPADPLALPPDAQPTEPSALTEMQPQPRPARPPAAPVAFRSAALLQAFYEAIESHLARDLPPGITPARIRRTLIRHAAGLPRPQQHAASMWWSGQVHALDGDWPAGRHGTQLVNVIYVALAELLGPVRADQCFTHAVERLEASGDRAAASIRRYL